MATSAGSFSVPSSVPWADLAFKSMPDPSAKALPYLITAILLAFAVYSLSHSSRLGWADDGIPHLNPRGPLEFTDAGPKKQFVAGARQLVAAWFAAHPDRPARMTSDFGDVTLLPPSLANEIRNDDRLSFSRWTYKAFHAHLPGFEGFREGSRDSHIVQAVILKDLTKYLNKVTAPLSEETGLTLAELLPTGDGKEWQTINLRETMLRVVARISSRVFLGEELCRDEAWLDVTRNYTLAAMAAAAELRLWPSPTRLVVHWFLPSCRRARALVAAARRAIEPVLEQRRRAKRENAESAAMFDDALEWFERTAGGRDYDAAIAQLSISMAAIHTTTDLVCQVLLDLAAHPDVVEPLREEIAAALRDGGWRKTSLYNMRLLDSVIKETQRLKPIGIVAMRRVALSDVTLSDGTAIHKGSVVAVSSHGMWDEAVHANADTWDGQRFLRMRSGSGGEHAAQSVSTGPDHLAFGHGRHACPGRFFAVNEAKIALAHLLLKFDWRLPAGAPPPVARAMGFNLAADPFASMQYRPREPEVDVDAL
ncbi:putative cytochrome P450 monooxygenase [Lasiosphaeria miniovina]|uniref:Cytochrome P450 monooxygenase n=1 Tax=Lasiosphaeria miniovina TaxID=1954250 RepID=A0AA40E2I1_9PEZI|nr:putative cytochrome P450 monooxygenase [Lasiosphaeria miniovina]KAK0721806.1 putative cytochrome P450 monooxygenase [Lasiosphaeria miniovina]